MVFGQKTNRRSFTLGSAAAFAAVTVMPGVKMAAQDATPATSASPAVVATGAPEDTLEVFSWWTGPGEHDGLVKLFEAFSANFPDVSVVDAAVAGGAGSNAKAALSTRLGGGDPPDSWQSHAGKELQGLYIEPGYAAPVTEVWDAMGLANAVPQGLIDQVTFDGSPYLIPVGVHMGNVLFINKNVAADNGIEFGETITADDFFAAADTLKAAGVTAVALGSKDPFAGPHLFENTLMGSLGAEAYVGLWDGTTAWDSAEVTTAIEQFAKYLDYVNDDHAALTWDGAMDLVLNGTALATSMGDWAYGAAVSKDSTDVLQWAAHPGSDGIFSTVMDGFTLPEGAPHPNNALNWLAVCGSAEAQAEFAPYKGCIPARTDADTSNLSQYGQWAAGQFASATAVPSNAHGAAASPQMSQDIFDAVATFLVDKDVAMLQDAIVMAAEADGLGQ